jgi:hypothetical protein
MLPGTAMLRGGTKFWKVNMLDPPCRFPAIFENLSVALTARHFGLYAANMFF